MKSKQVQEFKETEIGDVCPFAYGKGLPERERNIGKFPVYGSNGIVGWHDTSFLNGPCIIIGRKGSIGKIHYSENPCWPIDTTFYIIENENYHLKFIFYLLKFLDLENMDSDTSVPGLNRTAAHELEINIPEKKEQIRISSVLENLDTKISNLQNQNRVLEQTAQAIFQSWFVDFDGVTEFEDSELGKIPKGWSVKTIRNVCNSISITHSFNKSNLIFLNTGDIQSGKFLHKNYASIESFPGQAKKSIKKNDILFTEIRPKNKRYAYVYFDAEDYVVSTKLMVLRTNNEFHSRYLYQFLINEKTLEYLQLIAETRSGTFPQITFNELSLMQILIPSDELLLSFNKNSENLSLKITKNEKSISILTKTRDTLLPKLISGEIRV